MVFDAKKKTIAKTFHRQNFRLLTRSELLLAKNAPSLFLAPIRRRWRQLRLLSRKKGGGILRLLARAREIECR